MRTALKPGIWLMSMYWWIYAILIVNVIRYPPPEYWGSYLQTFTPIGIGLTVSALLYLIESQTESWRKWNVVLKLAYTMISYAVCMGLSFYVAVYLIGPKGYFGGDPEGNIVMGYLPSVVMNLIIALGVGVVWAIYKSVKSNQAL